MRHHNFNDGQKAWEEYNSLTDDMLYDIILNLRNNNLTFDFLAEDLGLTTEELLIELTKEKKDFFLELESINVFEKNNIYKNYNTLRKNRR